MPSTYTTNGGIELIATGEQSGTWGDTTNDNLQIIDRLTNGVGAITLTGTTHTLTTSDGALSDGQYKVLVFGGTPSGTNTVTISPNTGQHLYFVKNGSGQSVVLTQGSGGNVTVANGKSAIVYADGAGAGAAVVDLTSTFVPGGALLAANNLSDLTNVATARVNLDLEIGVDVQAYDADLAAIAGLAVTDGNIIVGNGTTWVAESGATARTSLGIGTGDSPTFAGITTGQVDITATGDLRLQDTTGGQYVALQAPGTVSSSFTLTLPAADGTNGQVLQTNGSGALSFVDVASGVSYPQESKSADYTLVLADAGKQIFHPASDNNQRTFTIPANSSVAFPVGTVVLFTQDSGSTKVINVEINSDTLVTNASTTGSVFVGAGNTLYCIKVTSTKWFGYYMYQSTITPSPSYVIAVAHTTTPYLSVYPWSNSGFGAKYDNPASLPAGGCVGVDFSPSGDAIAAAHSNTPYVTAYPFSGSGFGVKFSDPATPPASSGQGVAFSPAGDAVAVAHFNSPFITAYPWSGSGFGVKFSDPATLPSSTALGVTFSPAGDAIAVAHENSPRVTAYPWSGSGFGTKFSDPATEPTGNARGVAFSPAGDAIAVAHLGSPYISVYPWSGSGFGVKFSDPGSALPDTGYGVAFSPAGDAIAIAHDTSPRISAYPWSGSGFGTKFFNPSPLPGDTGRGVEFSPDGDAIAVAHLLSPYITAYGWSGSGFGSKFSNPSTLPASAGLGVAFTTI